MSEPIPSPEAVEAALKDVEQAEWECDSTLDMCQEYILIPMYWHQERAEAAAHILAAEVRRLREALSKG